MNIYVFMMHVIHFLLGGYTASFIVTCVEAYKARKPNLTRSVCWKCNHKLNFIDLLPVFGYLVRKGKCKYCGNSINFRYCMYEAIGAILAVILLKL